MEACDHENCATTGNAIEKTHNLHLLADPPTKTNTTLIRQLEELLAMAKDGTILQAGTAYERAGGGSGFMVSSVTLRMAGIIGEMQYGVFKRRDEDDGMNEDDAV